MTTHDFKRCSYDTCMYFRNYNGVSFTYLLLYVDDMLIAIADKS